MLKGLEVFIDIVQWLQKRACGIVGRISVHIGGRKVDLIALCFILIKPCVKSLSIAFNLF